MVFAVAHVHPVFVLFLTFGTYSLSGGADQSASPQTPSSASPSTTVLRATTRLVVVDVVATDSKGEPVLDLTADDFTVLEDGKPQKISGFSFQQEKYGHAGSQSAASGGTSATLRNIKT